MNTRQVDVPSISIIIPVMNEETFIRRCLLSLLEQDHPSEKLEILVVDCNSQDGTVEIVKELAALHDSIKLLSNPDGTVQNAIRMGIAHAKGDLILRGEAGAVYAWYYVTSCIQKAKEVHQVLY
jgi:glycosyltransferase involved in cell wall biosynthesis